MTSWDHAFIQICAVVLSFGAVAVMLQPEFAGAVVFICTLLLVFFWIAVLILSEFAAIRERLDSVDRRTARMEGHRVGNEVLQAPFDGE